MRGPIVLRVEDARVFDVGLGRARIDAAAREALGAEVGDVLGIAGTRSTGAPVFPLPSRDEGRRIIRIDALVRLNAGAERGGAVRVSRASPVLAQRAALAQVDRRGHRVSLGRRADRVVRRGLLHRPLSAGDVVIVPGLAPIGGAVAFRVLEVEPEGLVRITDASAIEVR